MRAQETWSIDHVLLTYYSDQIINPERDKRRRNRASDQLSRQDKTSSIQLYTLWSQWAVIKNKCDTDINWRRITTTATPRTRKAQGQSKRKKKFTMAPIATTNNEQMEKQAVNGTGAADDGEWMNELKMHFKDSWKYWQIGKHFVRGSLWLKFEFESVSYYDWELNLRRMWLEVIVKVFNWRGLLLRLDHGQCTAVVTSYPVVK